MAEHDVSIHDVSDTALWVAYYRAQESEKPNALFRDPLAKKLVGDRGAVIAAAIDAAMSETAAHTRVNVVIRTVIIDRFLKSLASEGVDAVINLGAGLDTRPYRLGLPTRLAWFEVDYPHMMDLKNERLSDENPQVQLERVALDLADRAERQKFFERVGGQYKNVVVLTEGVLPYLSEEQVAELAEDLLVQPQFKYWIADYISPMIYKHLQSDQRTRAMKNAPFRFYPKNPEAFFDKAGWSRKEIQFIPEVAGGLGIEMPAPRFFKWIRPLIPKATLKKLSQISGYMIMQPGNAK